eukprot:6193387-Pleurochrysis_carterae.AAC.1
MATRTEREDDGAADGHGEVHRRRRSKRRDEAAEDERPHSRAQTSAEVRKVRLRTTEHASWTHALHTRAGHASQSDVRAQ